MVRTAWHLKMRQIGWTQNVATNYQSTQHNIPEEQCPCGGHHWPAHPCSQDILPPLHHNLINTETESWVWELKSGVSVWRNFSAAASKRSVADIVHTWRSSVACTYNCLCGCVLCVWDNSYLYHHIGDPANASCNKMLIHQHGWSNRLIRLSLSTASVFVSHFSGPKSQLCGSHSSRVSLLCRTSHRMQQSFTTSSHNWTRSMWRR